LGIKFNGIKRIPVLPNTIQYVWACNNDLTSLPTLPESIQKLECSNNAFTILPEIPKSIELMVCAGNKVAWDRRFHKHIVAETSIEQATRTYHEETRVLKERAKHTILCYNIFVCNIELTEDVSHTVSSFLSGYDGETRKQIQILKTKI
jgi:hypothetical protein